MKSLIFDHLERLHRCGLLLLFVFFVFFFFFWSSLSSSFSSLARFLLSSRLVGVNFGAASILWRETVLDACDCDLQDLLNQYVSQLSENTDNTAVIQVLKASASQV